MSQKEEDPVLLDPTIAAQKKVGESMLETTMGKIGLGISSTLYCIIMVWAIATGNFFQFLNALSK